jgi:hypothetical protein
MRCFQEFWFYVLDGKLVGVTWVLKCIGLCFMCGIRVLMLLTYAVYRKVGVFSCWRMVLYYSYYYYYILYIHILLLYLILSSSDLFTSVLSSSLISSHSFLFFYSHSHSFNTCRCLLFDTYISSMFMFFCSSLPISTQSKNILTPHVLSEWMVEVWCV